LILCLKGLQLAYNPGDYLSIEQLKASKKLQEEYQELKKWALEPAKISQQTINSFVETVQTGLMDERHHKPAHKLHYIDWAIRAIDAQLHTFNKQLEESSGAS
jgi:hypothetical protein